MQYSPSSKNSTQASLNQTFELKSCIQIIKESITQKQLLFHGVSFHLNHDILQEIEQAKLNNYQLKLSPALLIDWRYYALFNQYSNLQSELTFSTYYQQGKSKEAMMRSVISFNGEVLHQISSNCLQNSELTEQITSAHYWLIEQLLDKLKLRLKRASWLNWFSWSLSILIVTLTMLFHLDKFQMYPLMLIFPFLMCWLLQWGIKRLLRLFLPSFHRWFLRQLLFGLFSRQQQTQQKALGILEKIGL